jgi:hypothetical protein
VPGLSLPPLLGARPQTPGWFTKRRQAEAPSKLQFSGKPPILGLFNNPVGCLTSLADLPNFLQKSAKSAVFLAEVVQ